MEKLPWTNNADEFWSIQEKASYLLGYQAGRDAQRESDSKICQDDIDSPALSKIEKYRAGFIQTLIDLNTGDL